VRGSAVIGHSPLTFTITSTDVFEFSQFFKFFPPTALLRYNQVPRRRPTMTTPVPSARPWREIAEEVSREQNSAKLAQLVEELNRAMAEQGVGEPHPLRDQRQAS
jgi:hypothetical protein